MMGLIRKITTKESGAVQIVEAAFVFPIMFIILFFLIYMGNAHYVKAQIESIVVENAIAGAGYCADPVLQTIKETGTVPSSDDIEIDPYRYIFGGMDDVEKNIGERVAEQIEANTTSLFGNMPPELKTRESDIAKFNNYIVFSTFSVGVKYEIEFPIKFLGKHTPPVLSITSYSEIAVNDATEFIRNTDMVIDYLSEWKVAGKIKDVFDKINEFLGEFAAK